MLSLRCLGRAQRKDGADEEQKQDAGSGSVGLAGRRRFLEVGEGVPTQQTVGRLVRPESRRVGKDAASNGRFER